MSAMRWQWLPGQELGTLAMYHLLALRQEVFVVEQNCPYQDADGLDLQAWQLLGWRGNQLVATLRVLPPDLGDPQLQIGRVVTAPSARGQGLGTELMTQGMNRAWQRWPRDIHISAQAHLQAWYETLGFVREGPEYLEDDIPHVHMVASRP